MPSFVMHHYFAARVCETAPPELARVCTAAPAAYSWGSQGPDPFFFLPLRGKSARLGSRMHRGNIAEAFQAMAQEAHGSAAALAYLLGFCTHYALDRTVHPYIEAQTRQLMEHYQLSGSAAHKLCETDLDAALLRWRGSVDPAAEPAYKLLDTASAEVPEAARMLAAAGNAAGGRISAAKAEQSMHFMRAAYTLFHYGRNGRNGLARAEDALHCTGAVSPLLRQSQPLPEDTPNRSRRVWEDWEGRTHTETFRTLAEETALPFARTLQLAACAACRRGQPFPERLFLLDYSGRQLKQSPSPEKPV